MNKRIKKTINKEMNKRIKKTINKEINQQINVRGCLDMSVLILKFATCCRNDVFCIHE